MMSSVHLGDGQHRATLLTMINLNLSLNPTQAAVVELLECKMIAPVYHFLFLLALSDTPQSAGVR